MRESPCPCSSHLTTMFSALSSRLVHSATTYFYLPVDEDNEDPDADHLHPKPLGWTAAGETDSLDNTYFGPSSASTSSSSLASDFGESSGSSRKNHAVIREILAHNDLYQILGVQRKGTLDRLSLRRAYLSRSKACHPDKFPGNPEATQAFQKVNVAYDVLSTPSSKRIYDSRPPTAAMHDFFSARPYAHAEETFRGVMLGVINDFLEGDLETVRTLLRAVNDLNPSLRMGEDGIDAVVDTLNAIRERALACRACLFALHSEVTRLLEVQCAFRELSYFDLRRRSRLTLELTRIAISLPIAIERAIADQRVQDRPDPGDASVLLNRRVRSLLRNSALLIEKVEHLL
ncbi:DnaJ-domain-containing protein [Trametopsis cervina]|nr:DnaJ-domain-containing protein [Trametopsis cervina]